MYSKDNFLHFVPIISGSGATYVRWGRTVCPEVNGTRKVYDGEHYANLCMQYNRTESFKLQKLTFLQ